jgi:inorganic pyrophosphatase
MPFPFRQVAPEERAALLRGLPAHADIVIDSPRFSHIKRNDAGGVDFVSPLPCPFNYGSVPGTRSADGDRVDAVVLGARLSRRARVRLRVLGVVHFVDAGAADPKWICAAGPLGRAEHLQLELFFRVYALAKRGLHRARGRDRDGGATRFLGIVLR